jgi:hypothetical protein
MPRKLYHFAPPCGFIGNESGEVERPAGECRGAQIGKSRFHSTISKARTYFDIEPPDNPIWSVLGGANAAQVDRLARI